jgi:hypothetical protein
MMQSPRKGEIMKKFYLLVALGLASTLCAVEGTESQPPSPPIQDPDLFYKDKQVYSAHLEFLYWKPLEGALLYALSMNKPSWNPRDTYPVGRYQHANYHFDPGFRVTLGYFRAPRYWELWMSYTRMTSRGKDSTLPPTDPNTFLTSTWPTYFGDSLSSAKSRVHLNYNVADLSADRYFIPNPHLRLRLIGGFTGTWMDQYWSIRYRDFAERSSHVRNRWKFGGAGFRIGIMADWFWTDDLYVTIRGSLAALVGAYKNTMFQKNSFAPGAAYNPTFPLRNAEYKDARSTLNLQLLVGPSWQKSWKKIRTELFAGYEISLWNNLQEIYQSVPGAPAFASQQTTINSGLLTLQGLTTRFSIDF